MFLSSSQFHEGGMDGQTQRLVICRLYFPSISDSGLLQIERHAIKLRLNYIAAIDVCRKQIKRIIATAKPSLRNGSAGESVRARDTAGTEGRNDPCQQQHELCFIE